MRTALSIAVALLVGVHLPIQASSVPDALVDGSEHPAHAFDASRSLHFEPNLGQFHQDIAFLARAGGYTLFLTPTEAVVVLESPSESVEGTMVEPDRGAEDVLQRAEADPESPRKQHIVRIAFKDAQPEPRITGEQKRLGKSNYFIGNDPTRWATDVPHFDRVLVEDLWPGIDMVFYGAPERAVQYDFIVEPRADPAVIRLAFTGAVPSLAEDGSLRLDADDGPLLRFPAPYTYQDFAEAPMGVESGFKLFADGVVGFHVGDYDLEERLVIDPVVVPAYSTFYGGGDWDSATSIAVDADRNAYITGETLSTDFPTSNAQQPTIAGGRDAFVAKFTPEGNLAYSTYLGGSNDDYGRGIAVDGSGKPHVAGWTLSTNFPTKSAYQPSNAGGRDAFVTTLNTQGALSGASSFSTYLGGTDWDFGLDIAVDPVTSPIGHTYVTGFTWSTDFPTHNAFQAAKGGGATDAFVARFAPFGGLAYSTYLGGSSSDSGEGIVVDAAGNAYVTGETLSTDFPTLSAYQSATAGGVDSFATKVTPGGALAYSTYLGGSGNDHGRGIVVDAVGSAYLTGQTESADFPTTFGSYQPANGGGWDGFVTKFMPSGGGLAYSTHLGGSDSDWPQEVAVDSDGSALLTGITRSSDFPTTSGAFQDTRPGPVEAAFVTKLDEVGGSLAYSTYYGGNSNDQGHGVAVDEADDAYIAGWTSSSDFPTTPLANQSENAGGVDVFVAKLLFQDENDLRPGPGWVLTGLWHVSNCRSFSPLTSLAFNKAGACPQDFDVAGQRTFGDAVSPPIDVPAGAGKVELRWRSWHQTEDGTWNDQKLVSISSDGGLTWTQLWQEDGAQFVWKFRSIDISSYAGSTVNIRFHFDSVNGFANKGEGWYVDEVEVALDPLYVEGFEPGLAPGWTSTGLWHVSSCLGSNSANSLAYSKPGTCPQDFDVGGQTSGDAASPSIDVPLGATGVRLRWESWHDTEPGTTWDQKVVEITADGGATWTEVWREDGPQSVWSSRSVDISGYAGSMVNVRFHFDSVDGVANNGEGWYVDDVRITTTLRP